MPIAPKISVGLSMELRAQLATCQTVRCIIALVVRGTGQITVFSVFLSVYTCIWSLLNTSGVSVGKMSLAFCLLLQTVFALYLYVCLLLDIIRNNLTSHIILVWHPQVQSGSFKFPG